ncbi:MAG: molybdate ABC transporter permease subunit [Proteocatella sp.]
MDYSPLLISIKTSLLATAIAVILGIFAAYRVIKMKKFKNLIDGIFTLPLVLPPTVIGFFLLITLGKNGFIGKILSQFGTSVIFTWTATVIASSVVAFPLVYRAAKASFEQMDTNLIYAAQTLGIEQRKIFFRIIMPNCRAGILSGTILAFSRAMGEFGATIIIAGNIQGKTQTMALAVYTAIQSGDRVLAYKWVFLISSISLLAVILMNAVSQKGDSR